MTNGVNQIPSPWDQGDARRKPVEFTDGDLLVKMIREDLLAQRISIDGCRDIIHYLRDHDAPTCRQLVGILAVNGERATDMAHDFAQKPAGTVTNIPGSKSP